MFNNTIRGNRYEVEGWSLPLYEGNKAIEGFSLEILNTSVEILMDYLAAHRKILYFSVTLCFPVNYPNYNPSNDHINFFMKLLSQALFRKGFDPAYLWVREKDSSSHHHYHLALFLNGSVTQKPHIAIEEIKRLWQHTIGNVDGCVHYESAYEHNIMLTRKSDGNIDRIKQLFKSISYFAKIYSKELDLISIRHYGYSKAKNSRGYCIYPNWSPFPDNATQNKQYCNGNYQEETWRR